MPIASFSGKIAIAMIAVTALIIFLRGERNGWYLVAAGAIVAVASVVWTFTVDEVELATILVRSLADLNVWLVTLWPTLNGFLAPITAMLDSLLQSIGGKVGPAQHHYPVLFLLTLYLIVRVPMAFICSLVAELAYQWKYRGSRNHDQSSSGQTEPKPEVPSQSENRYSVRELIVDFNTRFANSTALPALTMTCTFAILFLLTSVLFLHGKNASYILGPLELNPIDGHRHVLWLGIYILLIELGGQLAKTARVDARDRRRKKAAGPGDSVQRNAPYDLWLKAVSSYPKRLLFARAGEALPPVASYDALAELTSEQLNNPVLATVSRILAKDGAVGQANITRLMKIIEGFLAGDHDLTINEALHPVHLGMIFALCEAQQSSGRLSVIVCPDKLVDDVNAVLNRSRSRSVAALVQRSAILGRDPVLESRSYSYLLVAESDVETQLLGETQSVRALLDNLGLIVALDATRLQASRLRLQFSRLWLRVPRKTVRVLVQGSGEERFRQLPESIFGTGGQAKIFRSLTTGAPNASRHHILVWDTARSTSAEILNRVVPGAGRDRLEVPIAFGAFAWANGEFTRRMSGYAETNSDEQERAREEFATAGTNVNGVSLANAFLPDDRSRLDCQVISVEDPVGLPTLIGRFYDHQRYGDVLVSLSPVDYPLRDFHIGHIGQLGPTDSLDKTALCYASDPRGGVKEMLAALSSALRESHGGRKVVGLTRSEIEEHFLARLPARLIEQLQLVPGREGVKLLYSEFGMKYRLGTRDYNGETLYYIDPGQGVADNLLFTIPFLNDGNPTGYTVPVGDIGLTFLNNLTMVVGGKEYLVEAALGNAVHAKSEHVAQNRVLPRAIPVLTYRLRHRDETLWDGKSQTEPVWHGEGAKDFGRMLTQHYYARFDRSTDAWIGHDHDVPPLADGGHLRPNLYDDSQKHECSRRYQSVWHIRLRDHADLSNPKLPLTLSVIFQDVVRAMFPRWGHRLTVVSPNATPELRKHRTGLPQIASEADARVKLNRLIAHSYPMLELVPEDCSSSISSETDPESATVTETIDELDFFLIEDSDVDLGVVRALAATHTAGSNALVEQAASYLRWLARSCGVEPQEDLQSVFESHYHRFGGSEDTSDLLDWPAAYRVLNALAEDRQIEASLLDTRPMGLSPKLFDVPEARDSA